MILQIYYIDFILPTIFSKKSSTIFCL